MFEVSLRELADIVGGTLHFGSMPPLGGEHEPVGHVVADGKQIRAGDVLIDTDGRNAMHAMMQSALAVITDRRGIEPWAGQCVIEVDRVARAVERLAKWIRYHFYGTVVLVDRGDNTMSVADYLHRLLPLHGDGHVHRHVEPTAMGIAHAMLQWTQDASYAVLELDRKTNHEIEQILALCDPDIIGITSPQLVCLMTTVSQATPAGVQPTTPAATRRRRVYVPATTRNARAASPDEAAVEIALAVAEHVGISRHQAARVLGIRLPGKTAAA